VNLGTEKPFWVTITYTILNPEPLYLIINRNTEMNQFDKVELLNTITGLSSSQCIYAAVKLEIFDNLIRPIHYNDLACKTNTVPNFLKRLLLVLKQIKLVQEIEPDVFTLTEIGTLMPSASSSGFREMSLLWGEEFYRAWGCFNESLLTGETAFNKVHGSNLFEYLNEKPEVATTFNKAMTAVAQILYRCVPIEYDFSNLRTIVDVGGGCGALLSQILEKEMELEGILFDQPHVVTEAHPVLTLSGVLDRCKIIAGDFFEFVPKGYDAYMLSNIIHDWNDELAITILQRCHEAMNKTSKLLLIEMVLGGKEEPSLARMTDLNMLVLTGGQERTIDDFKRLLDISGFVLENIVPVQSMTCIIEARVK
jgi:O-methyltransferase domain/Dimerisation domain